MLAAACVAAPEPVTDLPVSPGPTASAPPTPSILDTGDVEGFEVAEIDVGDRRLLVAVADTPALRARGLMDVTDLGDLDGMLFVFDRSRPVAFWMKNTLIPLRVGYFGPDGVLFQIEAMEPCLTDDCPTYPSSGEVRWALEIPADRPFPPLGSTLRLRSG